MLKAIMIMIYHNGDDDIDISIVAATEPPHGKHKNRSPTTHII